MSGSRRKSLRYAYITSIAASLGGVCMLSSPLQLFVIKLGASELYLGLLSFFISYTGFFYLLSMYKFQVVGKSIVLFQGWLATAIIMIPMALLPIFSQIMPDKTQLILWIVLLIVAARGISDGYGSSAWFPILQDNVPARITGKFFARFRVYWQTSILLLIWAVSFYLGEHATYSKFTIIFTAGLLLLFVRAFACKKISELPPSGIKAQSGLLRRISGLLKHQPLKIYLLYVVMYNLAVSMPAPFQLKMLKNYGYSDGNIILATSMIPLSAIFTLKFWGKISDRYGNRSVFSICVLGNMINIFLWILVDDGTFSRGFIFVLYFMWGMFTAGNGIAQTRHMLHTTPKSNQAAIVLINIMSSISLAAAPLLGGIFLSISKNWVLRSGAVTLDNYHLLFVICTILFVVPYTLRRKLRITEEDSTSHVMSSILRPLRQALDSFIRVAPGNMTDEDHREKNKPAK